MANRYPHYGDYPGARLPSGFSHSSNRITTQTGGIHYSDDGIHFPQNSVSPDTTTNSTPPQWSNTTTASGETSPVWLNDLAANLMNYGQREPSLHSNINSSLYYNTQYSNTQPPLQRSYSPFGSSNSEPASDFSQNTYTPDSSFRQAFRFPSTSPTFASTSPPRHSDWTNGIPQYNPFGPSKPVNYENFDASLFESKNRPRTYSDVIKVPVSPTDPEPPRFVEKSPFSERPTSSTPPPFSKPRRKSTKMRSGEDTTRNTKPDNTRRSAEKENLNEEPLHFGVWNEADAKAERAAKKASESAKSSTSSATKPLFFDPKRIFQSKPNKAKGPAPAPDIPNNNKPKDVKPSGRTEEVILNNGKCTSGFSSTGASASKTHTYINNDLRNRAPDARKKNNTTSQTTQTTPERPQQPIIRGEKPAPKVHKSSSLDESVPNGSDRQRTGSHSNGSNHGNGDDHGTGRSCHDDRAGEACERPNSAERTRGSGREPGESKYSRSSKSERRADSHRGTKKRKTPENVARQRIEEAMNKCAALFWRYGLPALVFVPAIILRVLLLLASIILYYLFKVVDKFHPYWSRAYKFFFPRKERASQSNGAKSSGGGKSGLSYNITLPSTGEEAINRLLSCQGKDAYSILGLHGQCTDDDVKRYYRKQAILVHPDKNREPGAEESFKILHCAFEQIGTPEKRQIYDGSMMESQAAEEAAKQFADLLTKLETKLREAGNRMGCDKCKGQHQRLPVERPTYAARWCNKCKDSHMAKEGDCWAEASMFGFYWRYFACMDGKIYNITEWAKCQQDIFTNMRPNSHHVIYSLATNYNSRHKNQHPRPAAATGPGNINDRDLENLLKFMASAGASMPQDFNPEKPNDHTGAQSQSQGQGQGQNTQKKKPKSKKKRR